MYEFELDQKVEVLTGHVLAGKRGTVVNRRGLDSYLIQFPRKIKGGIIDGKHFGVSGTYLIGLH